MQQLPFRAMGCQMLAVVDTPGQPALERLNAAPGWFAEWEQHLSRFRPDSELARLNGAGRPMRVSAVLWQVLQAALEAARQSDGLVRPTLLGALEAAGYDRSFEALAPVAARPAPAPADWRAIGLNQRARTVALPAGARIDLGGIAKGWAADQAARRLAAAGPALVDAGGDVAVSGPMADGAPWPIAVENPLAPGSPLGLLQLARGGVATSGRDYRRWQQDGRWQHHIIDPRTGRPAETDVLAATVVAPDCVTAEAAAKVALIAGGAAGLAWIEARPKLAGLLVLEDGRVLRSHGMRELLVTEPASEPMLAH
jgi:thiamine biosynthesis lipoprotein